MKAIPLAYDSFLLDHANQRSYVEWFPEKYPHIAVLGNTGSGKSYFINLLLGQISMADEQAKGICCCYKNALLPRSTPNFYGYTSVITGFEKAEEILLQRLSTGGNNQYSPFIFVIDEYVGWLASMEDKDAKVIKKRMARMLTMARSLSIHIILGACRAMADDFSHGSRDCLSIIFLGSPSKESVRSFCSTEHAAMIEPKDRGEGYTAFDGQPPVAISVPTVQDPNKLSKAVLRLLSD